MKNKGLLALMLGAFAIGLGAMPDSTSGGIDAPTKATKPASKHGLRLPDSTPKEGPGPMCWPGIGGCLSM